MGFVEVTVTLCSVPSELVPVRVSLMYAVMCLGEKCTV